MRVNRASLPSETPPATEQAPSQPPSSKRPRKRTYAVLGIVAVVAVALALMFVFLTPPNVGTIIPLSYNYTPGEEMTYNMTATVTNATGQNTSTTATFSMNIISFDGQNYTINETTAMQGPWGSPTSFTITEKMNKTGYATYLNGPAGTQQTYSTFGNIASFFQKDQARVGETWQVPVNWGNSSYGFNGTFTYKFGDIQEITVPAGTYQVFKIDLSGSNLTMILNTPTMSITENTTVNGQMHLQYGTCRLIDYNLQSSVSILQGAQASTQNVSMQMKLVKHTKP